MEEATCKIVALMEENQNIVTELIGELAIHHAECTSDDKSIALSQVLQNQKDVLINISCVKKFADTRAIVINSTTGQVLPSIDPNGLDLTLSVNILRYINGLIPNGAADKQPCGSAHHVDCKCKKKHPCQKNNKNNRVKDVYGKHPGWLFYHRCSGCDKNGGRKQGYCFYLQIYNLSLIHI